MEALTSPRKLVQISSAESPVAILSISLITSWDTLRTGQIMCYMTRQFMCCLQV